jgi:hypothetical protein
MRIVLVAMLFAAAFVIGGTPAAALPGALADQAALSTQLASGAVEEVRLRSSKERKYVRTTKRRYDWTYYPYWRPYRYYYWQHYYPYGGPLF